MNTDKYPDNERPEPITQHYDVQPREGDDDSPEGQYYDVPPFYTPPSEKS